VTGARRTGYRLLGARFDYVLHTRPLEWPIVAAHSTVGYLLAVGLENAFRSERLPLAALGIMLWVVCLNGGTLALNSAYDRDEGDIAYLRHPPPPPRGLAGFGLALMLVGFLAAAALPVAYGVAYAVCIALSILYSTPPVRLKAVPGADWIINMWGFGTLTPYAGWATTGVPVGRVGGLVLLGFCPLFAALYPLTQLYQLEEDAGRGDQTLAIWLGRRRSLLIAQLAMLLAFTLFVFAGLQSRWGAGDGWRWILLAIAAIGWLLVLIPWSRRQERMTAREDQRGMYHALIAWAITDLAVVLAWGT
jgi:4-hydroxybenzoate polyprenyltransferase